jgi:two-component system response regulator RpfG
LLKPGRLTPEEFEEMKQHTLIGANMANVMVKQFNLDVIHNIDILKNIIIGHHERYDGSGYPYNIKGTDIPLEARIVALADVLDALTSERPYKLAWSFDDAFEYIVKGKNSQFDPDVIDAAVACRSEMERVSTKFQDTGLFKSDGLRDYEKPKL